MATVKVHRALLWAALISLHRYYGVGAAICVGPVCEYQLNVGLFKTMTYRGKDVHLNGEQLQINDANEDRTVSTDDVIVSDGFARDVILFNGTLPGPTIEVMEGVQIVVKVTNNLRQKAITVHWHGLAQNNTYFMDGAESITQCPILPGYSFTYRFWATPSGTHWYHAHMAALRLDGLFGMLIIHSTSPTIPYFSMFVNDWNHELSEHLEMSFDDLCSNGATSPPYADDSAVDCSFEGAQLEPALYKSSLFDGRGRWEDQPFPLKEYIVKSGQRYRFRLVNSGHIFPFVIHIDEHPLLIVASDGRDIQPISVESFYLFVAESIDFEIVANQTPGRYWIRADTQCSGYYARGILIYEQFENETADPTSQPIECTSTSPCSVFNCPFGRYPDGMNRTCVAMVHAKSTLSPEKLSSQYGIGDKNVSEVFMNFAMVAGPSINGRRFMMPSIPLFHNKSTVSDCVGEPCLDGCTCQCSGIISVPFGRTVRLIVSNLQPDPNVVQDMYHNVHVHGQSFVVLAEEFPTYDNATGRIIRPTTDIECGPGVLCAHPRWSGTPPSFKNSQPVVKDTLVIPVRGYVVVQFIANNPGYWMIHCHIDMHMMSGMALVLKVGQDKQFPKLPRTFPRCADDGCYLSNSSKCSADRANMRIYNTLLIYVFIFIHYVG